MSKIDYQSLRVMALKAGKDKWQAKKINGDFSVIIHGSYAKRHGFTTYNPVATCEDKKIMDFIAMANPDTVLSLLDEIKHMQNQAIDDGCRIAELEEALRDKQALIPDDCDTTAQQFESLAKSE